MSVSCCGVDVESSYSEKLNHSKQTECEGLMFKYILWTRCLTVAFTLFLMLGPKEGGIGSDFHFVII